MRTKLLVTGSLAAGLSLFAWQTISQVALPWHEWTLREFENAPHVIDAIRSGAPENGMYFAGEGVLAAVSFTATLTDKTATEFMVPMLIKQLGANLIVGMLLCLMVGTGPHTLSNRRRIIAAIAATAAALTINVSNAIWYGFSQLYTIVNSIDLIIGWSIAGATVGWVARRMMPAAHLTAAQPLRSGDRGSQVGSLRPAGRH